MILYSQVFMGPPPPAVLNASGRKCSRVAASPRCRWLVLGARWSVLGCRSVSSVLIWFGHLPLRQPTTEHRQPNATPFPDPDRHRRLWLPRGIGVECDRRGGDDVL